MTRSRVLVRVEGGLGDCLLSNRFIPAIREKHPDSEIVFAFENDRGEYIQFDLIKKFYPKMSDRYCYLEDFKDDVDHYYDLHIDKMMWTTYDIDWLSRFYYFPKPEIKVDPKDQICLHVTHPCDNKNLGKDYINSLVEEVLKLGKPIVAICEQNQLNEFSDVSDKIRICCSTLEDACIEVLASKAFVTIDSGMKYIAYSSGVPTVEIANYFQSFGSVHPMIKARWLIFNERGCPLNTDPRILAKGLENILENKIATLFPFNKSNKNTFNL